MRVGDKWFIAGYKEYKGKFYNWEYIRALEIIDEILSENEDSE